MAAQVSNAMKMMEEQLKNMPPEQAEMMRKMMKGRMPGTASADPVEPIRVKKTGEKDTILDHPCVRHDVFVGDDKISEMWVTSWKSAGVKESSFKIMREMGQFYADMLASLPNVGEMGKGRGTMAAMNEIDGFPVLTRTYDGETIVEETYYKSVAEEKVDAAAYEPPEGYSQQIMPGGPAGTK